MNDIQHTNIEGDTNELLLKSERAKYNRVWLEAEYRRSSPALRNIDRISEALDLNVTDRIIDFGCGSGVTINELRLRGFRNIIGTDISNNAWATPTVPVIVGAFHELPYTKGLTAGYCVDVMEHLPPEWVEQSLMRMTMTCPRIYFRIALFADSFGEMLGLGPLHLTVRTAEWWEDKLADVGAVSPLWSGEPNIFAALVEV